RMGRQGPETALFSFSRSQAMRPSRVPQRGAGGLQMLLEGLLADERPTAVPRAPEPDRVLDEGRLSTEGPAEVAALALPADRVPVVRAEGRGNHGSSGGRSRWMR